MTFKIMARRDEILKTFLEHEKLKDEYKISKKDIPKTVREGLNSEVPIIRTISIIIEKLESSKSSRDIDIYNAVTNYLSLNA